MHPARIALGLCLLLVAACRPDYGNGKVRCAPDNQCPDGYQCYAEKCWLPGTQPVGGGGGGDMGMGAPDLAAPPDMSKDPGIMFTPASVWSAGGGGSSSSSSGARLNLSVGGTVLVGAAKGSNGATVQYGYLGADTK
jgi:hypothetical protein